MKAVRGPPVTSFAGFSQSAATMETLLHLSSASLTHREERSKVMTTVRPSIYIIDHIDTHCLGFKLLNSHWLNLTGI